MSSVNLDPKGPFKRDALVPQQMRDRVTRTDETIVLCHLGVPRLRQDQWSLLIDGMVERTRVLSLEELLRYPRIDIGAVHQCCGSPLAPFVLPAEFAREVGGRTAGCVLADCWPSTGAKHLWSTGRIAASLAALSWMRM
jgi:DMSO/TMAO reductase YedYZ molybdopterin-dependent catalytic subunit